MIEVTVKETRTFVYRCDHCSKRCSAASLTYENSEQYKNMKISSENVTAFTKIDGIYFHLIPVSFYALVGTRIFCSQECFDSQYSKVLHAKQQ